MSFALPIPVRRTLRKLGSDIHNARRRRRITTQLLSERAGISRATLYKIEKGEPGVALGHYATVLFVLGVNDRLANLLDVTTDTLGLDLADEQLPKRVRFKKSKLE
ncbi:MAG: helix-turn-helix domain-containing protein [Legionellales bacterium]|nr:helix-turn-helix domain-containing protein [Legionellales bacterium]